MGTEEGGGGAQRGKGSSYSNVYDATARHMKLSCMSVLYRPCYHGNPIL